MIFDSIYFNCAYARTLLYIIELNDIISLHAFFFLHLHFKFTFTFTFLHQKLPVTFVTFVIAR